MNAIEIIRTFRSKVLALLRHLIRIILPASTAPLITSFSPRQGWPGTTLTVRGVRFSESRDGNVVMIGGDRALVITASPTELRVLAGERTSDGPVEVTTTSGRHASVDHFRLLPWPVPNDVTSAGAPSFFHGPQHGTPALGVADQPVLVVLTYPTDQDPGTPAQRTAARNAEMATFADARRFWVEATYGATSWAYTFTDWLALLQNRDLYFWQQDDIDAARRPLLRETKRSAAVSGNIVYAGHQRLAFVASDVSTPASPSGGNAAALGAAGTGVAVAATRAYVTAGSDGLYVFDLAPATPAAVTNVATTGWYHDVSVDGSVCAVAALGDGCLIYDITNPDSPALVATQAFGSAWATAVETVGDRVYVGTGTDLRQVDVTNPAAPVVTATVPADSWVLALAVSGSVCAVATDGSGVRLYDVSGTAPVLQSSILAVNRTHGVAIDGNTLLIAGADGGLLLYDITDPTAPASRGTLATAVAVYDVAVSGSRAYLSLGARTLAVVDIADLDHPSQVGSVALAGAAGGNDPDLATLRTNLSVAIDGQALLQMGDRLMIDAFQAADAAGFNLDDFTGLVVIVNGPFLRGQSWQTDRFTDGGTTFVLNEAKGIYYVATGADWGRVAHETGHWLGMWDIYTEWHSDGTYTEGTAAPWCMAGSSGGGPLWCAHQIQEKMAAYRTTTPNRNVEVRTWSPTAPALDEMFDIVVHDAGEDANAGRIHILKLVVSSGLTYYVEVRQKPIGLIFDQNIAVTNAVEGTVLVTRVTEGTSISNTFERPIMLYGAIDVGQQVVDAARRLTIRVEQVVQDRPLVYRVHVTWNQPVADDPSGQFDLGITPWTTDEWETIDVWVDSPRNNSGGSVVYENHEPGDTSKPIRNGDRPWVHRVNKFWARIRNTGVVDVTDAYVTFYANSPPGIGDNGDWATVETKLVPVVPRYDPAVPGSGEVLVSCDWKPSVGEHSCLKVAVLPQSGEIDVDNNSAQENVFTFDSAGSSSHDPVELTTNVRSPLTVWRKIDAVVKGLPPGWHAVVNHAWVWTAPKGTHTLEVVMWTDLHAPYDFTPADIRRKLKDEWKVPDRALIRLEGWTTFDHRYLPIGGVLADIKANRKVDIGVDVEVSGNHVVVQGCLRPPVRNVPITVEITDEDGKTTYLYSITDERGCFDLSKDEQARLAPGRYELQVFTTAGGDAAEASSEALRIDVRDAPSGARRGPTAV
ncbi:MAG: IPT/TIG domain-containing protein [Nocardioidaceae bacterium]